LRLNLRYYKLEKNLIMKKTKMIAAFIFVMGVISVNGQQRLTLIELFSGASCSPCAIHVPPLEDTVSRFQDKVVILRHQLNIPAYDPMYDHYPSGPSTRFSYYGMSGVPALKYDGAETDFDITQTVIDARSAVPSPFIIDLTYTKTDTNINVNMIINAVSSVTGNLKARIAVVENEIEYPSPPGSNGERFFFKVLKQFIPSPGGTSLNNTWSIGDADTISGSWTFANVFKKDEIAVIAYIQDDNTKEILQAAFAKPLALHSFDAAVTAVSDVPTKICQGSSSGIQPRVTIVNKGDVPVTKLELDYSVNDLPTATYLWNSNLNNTEYGIIHLPIINPEPLNLNNKLLLRIKSVNDVVLDANQLNDTLSQVYGAALETEQTFKIKFKTGNLGANFGWRIVNDNPDIHSQYWDYNINTSDTNVTITGLDPDCWSFVLKNINNVVSQNFNFRVYNMNDQLLYQTNSIGHTHEIPFYNINPVGISYESNDDTKFEIYPNPSSDAITVVTNSKQGSNIIFYNVLGEKVFENNVFDGAKISLNELNVGFYIYRVIQDGKLIYQGKLQKIK